MSEFQIIPMAERHVAAVAELEKMCFSVPWSENSVRNELNNPLSLWLVAISGDMVCGYIGSQSVAGESDMMNVAVHPEFRQRGIGMQLVLELMERLRKLGNTALLLEVRAGNLPAITLYERLGFVTVGVRPNYYFHPKEDAKIMRKELKES